MIRGLVPYDRAVRMGTGDARRRPRHTHSERVRAAGVELVELAELAAMADVVSVHVPLLPSTRGLVDARFLATMKPTAYLVNAAAPSWTSTR